MVSIPWRKGGSLPPFKIVFMALIALFLGGILAIVFRQWFWQEVDLSALLIQSLNTIMSTVIPGDWVAVWGDHFDPSIPEIW